MTLHPVEKLVLAGITIWSVFIAGVATYQILNGIAVTPAKPRPDNAALEQTLREIKQNQQATQEFLKNYADEMRKAFEDVSKAIKAQQP